MVQLKAVPAPLLCRCFALVCLMFCLGGAGSLAAAEVAPRAHEVQAAMLYKFLSYIDWPEDTFADELSPYRISVFGDAQIEAALQHITFNRRVNDRPIEVEGLKRISEVGRPQLLFVGSRAEKHLPKLARLARQRSFLIVTANPSELKHGSTINLRVIDDRIGFDVSLASAQRSNVRLSARLLSVAASIQRAER